MFKKGLFVRFAVFLLIGFALSISLAVAALADSEMSSEAASRLLMDRIGSFRSAGPLLPLSDLPEEHGLKMDATVLSAAARSYVSASGQRTSVIIMITESESAAYALLTESRNSGAAESREIGAVGYILPGRLVFAKGRNFVVVSSAGPMNESLLDFAGSLASSLPRGEEDIPVLVKHLPDWENIHHRSTYFVDLDKLKDAIKSPILDVVSFEGGAEAVVANYEPSRLVLIEFTTPQLATDNDGRIVGKLEQLRAQGQPVPSVYRRVGNYSVFVFDASDEQTANRLIDAIKYEQVTQWLGDNPYPFLEAQRRYTAQTLGVLVSVVKASGLALITCLTIGGIFGGLLFIRRRAQQRSFEAFSDAGGMIRINLDDMTPQTDPARLLGRGR